MDDELDGEERPNRTGFWLHVAPAVVYVLAVFYGGSIGMATVPGVEIVSADKLLHALAFGGMQLVFVRALRFELPGWSPSKQSALALGLASAVGALLELYQMALPHRSAELYDWVADTLGALLAAGGLALARRLRKPACPSERDGGA